MMNGCDVDTSVRLTQDRNFVFSKL